MAPVEPVRINRDVSNEEDEEDNLMFDNSIDSRERALHERDNLAVQLISRPSDKNTRVEASTVESVGIGIIDESDSESFLIEDNIFFGNIEEIAQSLM